MAYPGARSVEHPSPALPDLEGKLVLLAAPNQELRIVAAQVPEVRPQIFFYFIIVVFLLFIFLLSFLLKCVPVYMKVCY